MTTVSSPISTASSRRRSGATSRLGSTATRRLATSSRRSPNRRTLVRLAFDEVMHEPVPERLIAAARGETASRGAGRAKSSRSSGRQGDRQRAAAAQRWWIGLPVAASLFGLLLGGGVAYLSVGKLAPGGLGGKQPAVETAAADKLWLDNAAGYFKLFVSAGDGGLIDVPATGDPREALQKISQSLPQEVRLPDLKPWGLNFRGARLVVAEGRPAAQLVYTTDNKAIGPLTLIIGSSKEPDISADPGAPPGCQPALLAPPGPRLCARRPDRYRLSLGHRQRRRLAARRDLSAALHPTHQPWRGVPPLPHCVKAGEMVDRCSGTWWTGWHGRSSSR